MEGRTKRERRLKKSRSIVHITLEAMIPVCVLFLLLLLFMFQSVKEAQNMAYRYLQDMAAANAKKVKEDISMINSEMVYLIKQDKNIADLPEDITPRTTRYYELLDDVVSLNKTLKLRYGGHYFFYEYVEAADLLILDNHAYFPVSQKNGEAKGLEKMIQGYLSGETERSEWNYFKADEETFLFCFYETKGKSVGCIVNLEDLLTDFNISNLGYESIPFFIAGDGEILMRRQEEEENIVQAMQENLFFKSRVHTYELGRIGQLKLVIDSSEGILDRIVLLQVVSTVLAVSIVLVATVVAFVYYRRILAPMKQFVRRLSNPEEEKWLHDMDSHQLLELEMASKEFREMMRQIQSLKIAIYEKELLQSKTELEYVQEQIRPHFYLNCISVIHGMAEKYHAEDIIMIAEKLSDYFRYVVNDSYVLRKIGQEVAHIRDYIDIQKLRYEDFFRFEVMMDEGIEECMIPPLVLQVFVENAINHGVNFEKQVEITLYIALEQYGGEDCLYICISDTGEGFSEEALDKIRNGGNIVYNGRKHVGIQNTLKRLQIIYGEKAQVSFFNMTEHCGAVVELRIPVQQQEG